MVFKYIDSRSIINSIRYLRDRNIKAPKVFGDFLLLKFVGVNKTSWTSYDSNFKELAIKGAKNLMGLYGPSEKLPDKYELIDIFKMRWHPQSLSEGAYEYGSTRLWNNVGGGNQNWRSIVDTTRDPPKQIRFNLDYIKLIQDICDLHEEKISLTALSAWIARFSKLNIENENTAKDVIVYSFLELFKITQDEKKAFFADDPNSLFLSDSLLNSQLIRNEIGEPSKPYTLTERINEYPEVEGIIMTEEIIRVRSKNPDIDEVYAMLEKVKQIILFGPPGTSKTYYSKEIADKYFNGKTQFIQLHPNYTYEDFIGGYKIEANNFIYKDGVFAQLAKEASNDTENKYLLLIDEINRANLSKIFGEVFVFLDREYKDITLSNTSEKISLPSNLYIIGTMNSSDRSIALVDIALRRRFKFIYLHPDEKLLGSVTDDSQLEDVQIVSLFNKLNDNILEVLQNKDIIFGHSFFMPKRLFHSGKFTWTWEELEFEFNAAIVPMIEEYCFGNDSALIEVLGENLASRLKGDDFKKAIKEYLG